MASTWLHTSRCQRRCPGPCRSSSVSHRMAVHIQDSGTGGPEEVTSSQRLITEGAAFLKKNIAYSVIGAEAWNYADSFDTIPSTPLRLYLSGKESTADVGSLSKKHPAQSTSRKHPYDPLDTRPGEFAIQQGGQTELIYYHVHQRVEPALSSRQASRRPRTGRPVPRQLGPDRHWSRSVRFGDPFLFVQITTIPLRRHPSHLPGDSLHRQRARNPPRPAPQGHHSARSRRVRRGL